ncbi:MAG: glucosaminidase domain-containing protein [Bacteroidia bacterium]|jgi:flagellum-specific peptidoglycan hydrolase FlgJ
MKSAFIILGIVLGQCLNAQKNEALKKQIEEIYTYIKCCEIQHPEIVLRQAIWETGWFKSDYCRNRHNLFGFRHTKTYMTFNSWQESVEYYKKWQEKRYKDPNEDYYKFLVRVKYATSKEYVSKLKSLRVDVPEVNCSKK